MFKTVCVGAIALLLGIGAGAHAAQKSFAARDLTVQQLALMHAGKSVGSLAIAAWVNRKDRTYARGDVVRLFVTNKSNENIYVTVIDVGPEQPRPHVTQLFPNQFQKSQMIKAHRTLEIAGRKNKAEITVSDSQPVGAELIKVIATNKPGSVIPVASLVLQGPFFVIKGGVGEAVRDLQVTGERKHVGDEKIATIALKIQTVAKR